jgi:hypothetical protein
VKFELCFFRHPRETLTSQDPAPPHLPPGLHPLAASDSSSTFILGQTFVELPAGNYHTTIPSFITTTTGAST